MKCCIVKDLLSNYIDGLSSEETNAEIREHLDGCEDCRNVYEKMSAAIPKEILAEEKNIDFLKKLKAKMRRRNVMVALSTCIILLAGFYFFASNYEIPIPFDEYRMGVEFIPAAVITNEEGKTVWEDLDSAISNGLVPEDYDNIINVLHRVYRGIHVSSELWESRVINRNGEEVRVIYYCYTKTLWSSLFVDPDLMEYSESGTSSGTNLYGDSYQSVDYQPQKVEIYYRPLRSMEDFAGLSDEEYDAQKENAMLVFHGVI